MSKNYVHKPKTQNSAEFRVYLRNVLLEYDKQLQKLYAIEDTLKFMTDEMKSMPNDGPFDVVKISEFILKSQDKVNLACYVVDYTLGDNVKEREALLANPVETA